MTTQTWSGLNTRLLDALLLVALFLAVWQGLYEYAGDAAIPAPLATLGYASTLVKTSNFWTHAQATLVAFAYALLRCGTPDELQRNPELRLRLKVGLRKDGGSRVVTHEHHSFPSP